MAGRVSVKGRRQASNANSNGKTTHKEGFKSPGMQVPHENQQSMKGLDKKAEEVCNPHDTLSQASGDAESPIEPSTPKSQLSKSTRKKKNRKERERAAKVQSKTSSPRISSGDLSESVPYLPVKAPNGVEKEQLVCVTPSVNLKDESAQAVHEALLSSSSLSPADGTSSIHNEDATFVARSFDKTRLVLETSNLDNTNSEEDFQYGSSAGVKEQNKVETGNPTEDAHSASTTACGARKCLQDSLCRQPPNAAEKVVSPLPMNMVAKEKLCCTERKDVLINHVVVLQSVNDTPKLSGTSHILMEEVEAASVGSVDIQTVDEQSSSFQSDCCLNREQGNSQSSCDAPTNDVGEREGTEAVCRSSATLVKRPQPHEDLVPCLPCGGFLEWFQAWFGRRAPSQEV